MLSRSLYSLSRNTVARRTIGNSVRNMMAEATGTMDAPMKVNISMPSGNLFEGTADMVIIPGLDGDYGVTKNHSPIITQLKAGCVSVFGEGEKDAQKFFVSGGFALTHANSVTDIAVVEAAKLEDLDSDAIKEVYNQAQKDLASSPEGSKAKAEALVEVETAKSMAAELGITL